MLRLYDIPSGHQLVIPLPLANAADATADVALVKVPDKALVTAVEFVPLAAVTGADTNSRTLTVTNHTNSDAQIAQTAFVGTPATNATIAAANAMTLSGTAANLNLSAGDIIKVTSTKVGTGLALPAGSIVITVKGR